MLGIYDESKRLKLYLYDVLFQIFQIMQSKWKNHMLNLVLVFFDWLIDWMDRVLRCINISAK